MTIKIGVHCSPVWERLCRWLFGLLRIKGADCPACPLPQLPCSEGCQYPNDTDSGLQDKLTDGRGNFMGFASISECKTKYVPGALVGVVELSKNPKRPSYISGGTLSPSNTEPDRGGPDHFPFKGTPCQVPC